jgi:ubiquitin-protein ligase
MSNPNLKRLARDVADLARNPLTEDGIYYYHHEDNIMQGTAVIRGPADSQYSDGYFVFAIEYPAAYPIENPKVKFLTRAPCLGAGGENPYSRPLVRLHPNLYTKGKVCLSLLGTWKGQPWTACCNIRMLLTTIQSLLDDNPYAHEPDSHVSDAKLQSYNEIVRFHSLYDGLALFARDMLPKLPIPLQAAIAPHLTDSIVRTMTWLTEELPKGTLPDGDRHCPMYTFSTHIDYNLLFALLHSLGSVTPRLTKESDGAKLSESAGTLSA